MTFQLQENDSYSAAIKPNVYCFDNEIDGAYQTSLVIYVLLLRERMKQNGDESWNTNTNEKKRISTRTRIQLVSHLVSR